MKRTLLILLIGLSLTACGGGGSETSNAAKPPAPQGPQNPGNGGNGAAPEAPEAPQAEPELSLSCKRTPGLGTVEPGEKATATFKFSKGYNGAGTILYGVQGGLANTDNTFINGNQLVVTRTVPSEGKYTIQLNVNGTGLSATCTWTIAKELALGF